MKLKKFLAGLLTVALVMAPMTAMASSTSEVEIDGEATYVETNIMVVTLPTSTSLKFNLDPTGVYGYFKENNSTNGDSVTTGDLVDYAGKIVGIGYDEIVNKSSVDVVVTCDYKLTSTATDLNVVTSGDVTTTGNDVKLQILGGTISGGDYTVENAHPTAIDTTSTKALVALEAIDYEFTLSGNSVTDGDISYVPVTDSDENKAYFSIGGTLSKDGDWSELKDASNFLKLSCVYSFRAAKDVSVASTVNGFVTANAEDIEYLTEAAVDNGYSVTASNLVVTISELVGTTIKTGVMTRTDSSTMNLTAGNHFTVTDAATGKVTIKQALVESNASAKITFTLANGETVEVQFK